MPAQIVVNPSSLDFGTIAVSETKTLSFVVQNFGDAVLNATLTAPNNLFQLDSTIIVVQSGSQTSISVNFSATSNVNVTGKITIISNDSNNSIVEILVSAISLKATYQISTDSINWYSSKASLGFGTIAVQDNKEIPIYIKNTGSVNLLISSIISSNPIFSISQNQLTIAPSQQQALNASFTPGNVADNFVEHFKINTNGVATQFTLNLIASSISASLYKNNSSLDFGITTVGNIVTRTLIITNLNPNVNLILSSITCSDSTFFTDISSSVVKNNALTITVSFEPSIVTSYHKALTIVCNDMILNPVLISLTGVGKIAPKIKVSTNSINFGSVPINTGLVKKFTITNIGQQDLKILSIFVNYSQISVSITSATIQPNKELQISLTFTPATLSNFDQVLTITSNDPDFLISTIDLQGSGSTPSISINPEVVRFPATTVNTVSQSSYAISNSNTKAPLIVSNIVSDNSSFAISETFPLTINALTQINITFNPQAVCEYTSNITVFSNDFNNPQKQITVSGTGAIPNIAVNPLNLDFSNVSVNTPSTLSITIHNTGAGILKINNIVSSNAQFTVSTTTLIINPNQSASVNVVFTPISVGSIDAVIDFINNDPNNSNFIVGIKGTGANPQINISPSSLIFGDVPAQTTKTMNVTIQNSGIVPLKILSVTTNPSTEFTTATLATTIAPDSVQIIAVNLLPTATTAYSANLVISSNDPLNSTKTISLTGTGVRVPKANIQPMSLTFPSTQVGSSSLKHLKITNSGNEVLNYNIIAKVKQANTNIEVEGLTIFSIVPTTGIVTAGNTITFDVAFKPDFSYKYSGRLHVSTDDPLQNNMIVTLDGVGIAAVLKWRSVDTSKWMPEEIKTIAKTLNSIVPPLVDALKTISSILDVVKQFIISFDDLMKLLLTTIKKTIDDFVNDLGHAGLYMLYVLPGQANINHLTHPMYYMGYSKDDLLKLSETTGWFDSVKGGYNSFIQKVVQSFDDPGDGNRPNFKSDAMVGAYVMMFDSGVLNSDTLSVFINCISKLMLLFNNNTFKANYEPPTNIIAMAYKGVVNLTFTPSKSIMPKEFFIFRSEVKGGVISKDDAGNTYVDAQSRPITEYQLVGVTNVALQVAALTGTTYSDANTNIFEKAGSSIELANSLLGGDPIRFVFEDINVVDGTNYYYVIAAGYTTGDITFNDVTGIIDKQKQQSANTSKYAQIIAKNIKTSDFVVKKPNIQDPTASIIVVNPLQSSQTLIYSVGALSAEVSAKPATFITSTDGMHRCRNYRCGFDIAAKFQITLTQIIIDSSKFDIEYAPVVGSVNIQITSNKKTTSLDPSTYIMKSKTFIFMRPGFFHEGDILDFSYSYLKSLQLEHAVDQNKALDTLQTYSTVHKPIVATSVVVTTTGNYPTIVSYTVISNKDGKIKVNMPAGTVLNFTYDYYSDFSDKQFFKCVISDNNRNFFDVQKCDSGSTLCPKYDNANCYFNNGSACTNKDTSQRLIVGSSGATLTAGSTALNVGSLISEDIPFANFYDPVACQNGIMHQRCDGYSKTFSRMPVSAWPDWSAYQISAIDLFPQIKEVMTIMDNLLQILIDGISKMDSAIVTFINLLEAKIKYLSDLITMVNSFIQNLIENFSIPNVYFLSVPFSNGGNAYIQNSISGATGGPKQDPSSLTSGVVLLYGASALGDALKLFFG